MEKTWLLEDMSQLEAQACLERLETAPKQNFVIEGEEKTQKSVVDQEFEDLQTKLLAATERLRKAQEARAATHQKRRELTLLRESIYRRVENLERSIADMEVDNSVLKEENKNIALNLEKYMRVNVLNDAFYIWYSGPYATINNFRLGNLSVKVIDWLEINTALGQAALALTVVAQRLPKDKFLFTKYQLYPMGSQSKVYKVTDSMIKAMFHRSVNHRMSSVHQHAPDGGVKTSRGSKPGSVGGTSDDTGTYKVAADAVDSARSRANYNYNYHFDRHNSDHFHHFQQTHQSARGSSVKKGFAGDKSSNPGDASSSMYFPMQPLPAEAVLLNLFMDSNQTFSLFPRSKFNYAIYGLFCCIYELGEYIQRHDPPLSMPYKIDIGDSSGRTCTIVPVNPANKSAAEPLDLLWHGSVPVSVANNTNGGSLLIRGSGSSATLNTVDDKWTRALKFALADIKWIIAWSTKHYIGAANQS